MYFQHAPDIWRDFPQLVAGTVFAGTGFADGIAAGGGESPAIAEFTGIARARLARGPESELPEIRAWRRAFAAMGLKPTQYRCAAESLLRRLRKEGSLPLLHPLVDVCNAVSAAFAVPVAVFDAAAIGGHLEVRYADGDEKYLTFAGEWEQPAAGEVIFADDQRRAHARRWSNRQSGLSAVRAPTSDILIVAEALHDSAPSDMPRLVAALTAALGPLCSGPPESAILSQDSPRFVFAP